MNLHQLIDALTELADTMDGDEVRLATQPSWPLAFHVAGIRTSFDIAMDSECDDHGHYNCDDCAQNVDPIVWIVQGDTCDHPYAPSGAFAA